MGDSKLSPDDPTLTADLFLTIASQPIGVSRPEDWVAEQMVAGTLYGVIRDFVDRGEQRDVLITFGGRPCRPRHPPSS